jgi:hypothetical protein
MNATLNAFDPSLLRTLLLSSSLSAQSLKIEYSEDDDEIESVDEQDDDDISDKKKRKHTFELDTKKGRISYYDSKSKKRRPKLRHKWYSNLNRYYEEMPIFFPEKKPSVSVAFGTQGSIYTAPNTPITFRYFDASLGYINEQVPYINGVSKYGHQYLFLSNQTNVDVSLSFNPLTDIESNVWRAGLGSRQGYGYRSGSFSLTPYHGNALVWTNIAYTNFAVLSESEQRLLSDYRQCRALRQHNGKRRASWVR